MHAITKLGSFMALRANGWSLTRISKELAIGKTTLWEWDQKHQNQVYLLKHLQLEKIQEQFLPTFEEDLRDTSTLLARVQKILETRDMAHLGTEFLMQMSVQLRGRLNRMREQVPLRTVPFNAPLEPLPFTGCVTRQDLAGFTAEHIANSVEPVDGAPHQNGHVNPAEPQSQNRTFPNETGGGIEDEDLSINHLRQSEPSGCSVLNSHA